MLQQRIFTSIFGLLTLIGVFSSERIWIIQSFFVVIVALSCWEIASIIFPRLEITVQNHNGLEKGEDLISRKTSIVLATLLGVIAFTASSSSSAQGALGLILASIMAAMVIGSFSTRNVELAAVRIIGFMVTVCYGALPWMALWGLYFLIPGGLGLFFLLTVVWAGDTGAYFGGLAWGKNRLAPWLSPKKTIEGAFFGLLASAFSGLLFHHLFLEEYFHWSEIILAALVAGVFGQIGDLVESLWKRFSMVKDSGSILPGHGGFLDRVDGLLFAGPMVWFILHIVR